MSLVWLAGIQTAVRGQECLPDNMKCGKLYVMYIVIGGVTAGGPQTAHPADLSRADPMRRSCGSNLLQQKQNISPSSILWHRLDFLSEFSVRFTFF